MRPEQSKPLPGDEPPGQYFLPIWEQAVDTTLRAFGFGAGSGSVGANPRKPQPERADAAHRAMREERIADNILWQWNVDKILSILF